MAMEPCAERLSRLRASAGTKGRRHPPGGRRLSAAQVLQQAPYAQRLARLVSNTAAPAVAHNKAVMQWLRKEVLLLPEEEEARPEANKEKAVSAYSVCASLVHA